MTVSKEARAAARGAVGSGNKFYVRIDEDGKTPQQLMQRRRTYEAADTLKTLGFDCEVIEYFTGGSKTANAAGIILKQEANRG
jgi:hypothetical protein